MTSTATTGGVTARGAPRSLCLYVHLVRATGSGYNSDSGTSSHVFIAQLYMRDLGLEGMSG